MKYSGQHTILKLLQLIKSKFDGLSDVAISGSYNDLTDLPPTVVRDTVTVAANNTSIIQIPFNIRSVDTLSVYYRGLLLVPDVHYTANISNITLLGFTASAGDLFTFISGSPISTTIAAAAVMFSDNENFGECTNVDDALEHLMYERDTVAILAAEASFRAYVNSSVLLHSLDSFCIETFSDINNIDISLDDGATVTTNYYDSERHIIDKTSLDILTIQSTIFNLDDTPYKAWIYADYDGEGSISLYFSKNDGSSWTLIENDTLTDVNYLVQKNVKIKVVLEGQVRLKNIAWGCR